MINLKEYRIGNWVGRDLEKFPFNIFRVVEIGETMKVELGEIVEFYDYRDLEPVPMVEAFIKSIGFERLAEKSIFRNDWRWMKDAVEFDLRVVNNRITAYGIPYELKFVHQLQNIFYFSTGVELNLHP